MKQTDEQNEQQFNAVVSDVIRLTQYSHGAGCGCKISPKILDKILHSEAGKWLDPHLLVGNDSRDDAAVYDIGDGKGIISTTDFFMPIVDDPFTFGRIAATNAISDIYAMGGKPIMAIAILGFPIDKLPAEVARRIVDGGRTACKEAGISLAGGHSIDSPEPIFGLAVTGIIDTDKVKKNNQAKAGDQLFLTKPLGIGIYTTAEKKGKLKTSHHGKAAELMCQMNKIGAAFSHLAGVHAMTDVTGFGLLGHLSEICQGSNLNAKVRFAQVPCLPDLDYYLEKGCIPGGSKRNFDSYGHLIGAMSETQRAILCDPQTSGGLLIAVDPSAVSDVEQIAQEQGILLHAIGALSEAKSDTVLIEVI
ncbi:selenide, water dikinase SelD [Spirabiliibacterium falconis]|uniref:selenide, water dikinase SelD n=1 Tax=Spirabiliibacterium falconis TaxID=572023 RepID=UPI001AAD6D1F|nr:selenide, water dikinase SelD [Spirabiliibacterium falconis]MBE2893663.1 selenide, water dikinase SelD [Spirabiliibacterium falconis]